ncbi:MAG: carbohydrate-binding family 9-like protein [Candidatus Neomarinimicrobiota bacterium]
MDQYYLVRSLDITKEIPAWDSAFWEKAPIANIDHFHVKSSKHHPKTQVKLQYSDEAIYLTFRVEDKYVRAVHTEYNAPVNEDSCVEWFIKPPKAEGYYNFEFNAIGTLHVNYIIDPERDENGKRKNVRPIPKDHAKQIEVSSSFKEPIENEIIADTIWFLTIKIPFEFFDLYTDIKKINGSIWQGNLYKCGDKTSHSHWAAWSPVAELNFHQPKHFGEFIFSD